MALSDLWQLWCGEKHLSSPRQARDPGGLVQAEADCGPGDEAWGLSPNLWAFPSPVFEVKPELSTKACLCLSVFVKKAPVMPSVWRDGLERGLPQ